MTTSQNATSFESEYKRLRNQVLSFSGSPKLSEIKNRFYKMLVKHSPTVPIMYNIGTVLYARPLESAAPKTVFGTEKEANAYKLNLEESVSGLLFERFVYVRGELERRYFIIPDEAIDNFDEWSKALLGEVAE